ncbi:lytic transglycosylase domain-containing protein [Aeromonas veronii]|nr:lytic transglycosylase domain-containing protein [Aeromonas veronii]
MINKLFFAIAIAVLSSSAAAISDEQAVETCLVAASQKYSVNYYLLKAVLKTEGGYRGAARENKNGSFDYGWAQTNSIHLPMLQQYGITKEKLMYDPCYSIGTMAWMLASELSKAAPGADGFWQAVGNYHSKTPKHNLKYRKLVWKNLNALGV